MIFHECNNLPVKSMKAHNYFDKRYVFLVVSLQQYKLSIWRMNTVNEIAKWKKKPNVYQFLENVTLINHCLDVTRMRFFLWFFHTIFQGSWFLFPFRCVYPEHLVGFGRGTGRNHMFPYFWNVAETCNSMFPLCLRKSGPVPLYTQQRKREKTSRNR